MSNGHFSADSPQKSVSSRRIVTVAVICVLALALAANLLALYRMAPEGRAALGAKAKAYYEAHYRRTKLLRRLESFTLRGE